MIETKRPNHESGPCISKISSNNPVEADDDTNRINVSGTASLGYPNGSVTGVNAILNKSNAPEARSIPTATINPIIVGAICSTVPKPDRAPSTKWSYTGCRLLNANINIPAKVMGTIKLDKNIIQDM